MKIKTRIKLKNLKDKYVNKYTIAVACVIAVALLIWGIVSIVNYYSVPEDNPRNSEIANSGFSIEYNDRIIASLSPTLSTGNLPERIDAGIISTSKDGTDMQIISEDCAIGLNFDGAYIYYINNSDNGKIYRILPDGTGREMVFDACVYSMIYDEDHLYAYVSDKRQIVKISTSTFEETVLAEKASTTNLSIAGDKIYFFGLDGDNRKIASVNKNGGCVKYYEESPDGYSLVAYKDYLYYIDGSLTLKKIKIGSSKSKTVCDTKLYRFFIENDKIYYLSNVSATDGGAFEMDMSGNNSRKICNGSMRTLTVSHGRILSISLGYGGEPFLYIVDTENGIILESYEMIDEEKMTQEIYANQNNTAE